jgi:hypothetical protein
LKYLDYKKDVNSDAHVKVFNVVVKENGETFKEYIINAGMLFHEHVSMSVTTMENRTTMENSSR